MAETADPSGARAAILSSIRRALRDGAELDPASARALDARAASHRAHIRPAYPEPPVERFVAKLAAVNTTVGRVASIAEVAPAVAEYVKSQNLPARVVVSGDRVLRAQPWPALLEVERRAARADDAVAVTGALAGVGETGSLLIASGAGNETSLRFLPEHHVVVLSAADVVPHLEDAWERLRERSHQLPRAVNLITGPSKTADIEQTIQYGAHGPRRLHVVLIDGEAAGRVDPAGAAPPPLYRRTRGG